MIELTTEEAKQIMQLLPRVQLQGAEAPLFMQLVSNIDAQLTEELEHGSNIQGHDQSSTATSE